MRQLPIPATTTRYDRIDLNGGLDLLTPTLSLKSGKLRDVRNFEQSVTGGYARIDGYERHDGRPAPSSAVYLVLGVNITGTVAIGNTINGQTSGATGVVANRDGSLVVLTKTTGSFVVGENVRVGVTVFGTVTTLGGTGAAANWDAVQLNMAADVYRADIAAVPGSGPIRGVHHFNGVTYAWRDNVGATAQGLWKSTSGGWVAIALGFEVAFTLGTAEFPLGSILTQGGVTGTIRGVSLESGSWAGGTAAGRLTVYGIAGGSYAAGVATGGGGSATLSGAQAAITRAPGGRVEIDVGFLALGGGGPRMYGADGVNTAFEFDGTYLIPIHTGVTTDAPKHPKVFQDHLFLCFGAILKNSGITTPYNWSVIAGGAEHRCASTINALLVQPGQQSTGAMAISLNESTEMLYGTSSADFQKVTFEQSAGGKAYSAQSLGDQGLVFGDIGVMSLSASQNFGNFSPSSMTLPIRSFTQVRRNQCTASVVGREKSQYRLFFNDGTGLYLTVVNGKLIGPTIVEFPNKVTCACKGETPDGTETFFFGSDNGFVYRLDAGTSFDGEAIYAYGTLMFASEGNSRVEKRYRGASFEVQGSGYAEFAMSYDLNYGLAERPAGELSAVEPLSLTPAIWDAFTWDAFVWDGRDLAPVGIEMNGTGVNVALRIESNSDIYKAFTVNSVIIHYSVRKALKK